MLSEVTHLPPGRCGNPRHATAHTNHDRGPPFSVFRELASIDPGTSMAYLGSMIIKETSVFTRRVQRLLDSESYRLLQVHLLHQPDSGDIISGSGGIRKIRWAPTGSGKRGGARILYYWAVDDHTILMLFAFAKNERADLSRDQLKHLAALVQEEFS